MNKKLSMVYGLYLLFTITPIKAREEKEQNNVFSPIQVTKITEENKPAQTNNNNVSEQLPSLTADDEDIRNTVSGGNELAQELKGETETVLEEYEIVSLSDVLNEEEERLVKQAFGLSSENDPHNTSERKNNFKLVIEKFKDYIQHAGTAKKAVVFIDGALRKVVPDLQDKEGKTYKIYSKVMNVTVEVLDHLIKYSKAEQKLRTSKTAVAKLASTKDPKTKGQLKPLILTTEQKETLEEEQGECLTNIVTSLGSLLELL